MDLQSTNFGSKKPQFSLVDDPNKDDPPISPYPRASALPMMQGDIYDPNE